MKKLILSAFAFTLFVAANAQTSKQQEVSLVLQNQLELVLTPVNTPSFTFTTPDQYQNGITVSQAAEIKVRSNKPWKVTVAAGSAEFEGPLTDGKKMPANVLSVTKTGSVASVVLSGTAQDFTSGSRGGSGVDGNTFHVDYTAKPDLKYDGGTYKISVVFTATQQ